MVEESSCGTAQKKPLEALDYERSMLHSTAAVLLSGIAGRSLIHNAFLESFLIHARLLITFLYGGYKDGDIKPTDWLEPGNWRAVHPKQRKKKLRDWKDEIDKYLAHLTHTRLGDKPEWPISEMVQEIEAVLKEFYDRVAASQDGNPPLLKQGSTEGNR